MGLLDILGGLASQGMNSQQQNNQSSNPLGGLGSILGGMLKAGMQNNQAAQQQEQQGGLGGLLGGLGNLGNLASLAGLLKGKIDLSTLTSLLTTFLALKSGNQSQASNVASSVASHIASKVDLNSVSDISQLVNKLQAQTNQEGKDDADTSQCAELLTNALQTFGDVNGDGKVDFQDILAKINVG